MQIFLQILAVIGIILLCIIGLVLLVLGLVLFVPVRYKVKAHKDTEISAQFQVTWLLRFLTIKYMYPKPGEIVVRILGATAWKMKLGEDSTGEETEDVTPAGESESEDSKASELMETKKTKEAKEAKETKAAKEAKEAEKTKEAKEQEEKPNIFKKIQYKIKSIYDKIKKILADYEYYRDLLQQKENRLLFERCKQRLFKILKHIKPRVLKADVLVGTGEPDTTGYIMAIYGMLLPVLGNQINITPDFDREILEGRLYAKGRITIFNLLYNGARIYFDDQLHILIDKLKREDV